VNPARTSTHASMSFDERILSKNLLSNILHIMIAGSVVLRGALSAPKSNLVADEFLKKHDRHCSVDVAREIEVLIVQLARQQDSRKHRTSKWEA